MIHDYNDQPLTNCHGGSTTVLKILAHNALGSHEPRRNRKRKERKNYIQPMNHLDIYLELRYG